MLYESPGAAITKYRRPGGLNMEIARLTALQARILRSGVDGTGSFWGSVRSVSLLDYGGQLAVSGIASLLAHHPHLCLISPWHPHITVSVSTFPFVQEYQSFWMRAHSDDLIFTLDYLYKGSIHKQGYILRYWELGLQHIFFFGGGGGIQFSP